MHILHIIPYYAPAWAYGGSLRNAYELATRTAARGHTVTVLTTDALDASMRAEPGTHTIDGVTVHRLPNVSNALAWRRIFLPRGFGRAAARLIPQADIVHLHEVRSLLNSAALPVLLRTGKPYIVTPQGGLPAELGRTAYKRVYDVLWGRRLLENATCLHAVTGMERQQFLEMGLPASRIVDVPNATDTAAFDVAADVQAFRHQHNIEPDRPVVGFLGRLNAIKGVDFLVSAFVEVQRVHPEAMLVLVGPDDGVRPALEAQIARAGIGESVRFVGMISGVAEKTAAYRAFDVYVLPSRYEILGITLLEALLNGTPSITTDRCGLATDLASAGAAHVVPFGDVPALTTQILDLLEHPDRANVQARRGQAHIREHFNWDAIIARWLDVYRTCLDAAPYQR